MRFEIEKAKEYIKEQYSVDGQIVGRIEYFENSETFSFEIKNKDGWYVDWRKLAGIECSIRMREEELKDVEDGGLFK